MIRRFAIVIAMVLIAAGFSAGGCMGTVTNPSGLAMPTGNVVSGGETWQPIFSDDFNTPVALGHFGDNAQYPGDQSGQRWSNYGPGWPDTFHTGIWDSNRTVSVHDGTLDFYFHTENGVHYLAVVFPKIPGLSNPYGQLYGRWALRWKAVGFMPKYKATPILWPDSGIWPRDGEVDFPDVEFTPGNHIHAFMHRQNGVDGGDQDFFDASGPPPSTPYAWHTCVMEWTANKIIFYTDPLSDGVLVEFGRSTTRIPNTKMHYSIMFDTEPLPNPPADATQGHVLVDWLVAYKKV